VGRLKHEIVYRELATGEVISRFAVPKGPVEIDAAGDTLVISHSSVAILPFRLFGANYFITREDQYLSNQHAGPAIARWRIPTMDDSGLASAVSEDAQMVARLGSPAGFVSIARAGGRRSFRPAWMKSG
jgi:hypothetical protein